jgi:predicted amidophosphoribosyltransferase
VYNVTYCSNCGKEIDAESNFCPKCGVRTEKGVKEGASIPWASDPHWRQEMDIALEKASKAIDEGVKIVQDTFHEVAREVDKNVKTARTNVSERTVPFFCKNCGQENTRYARFCTKCGKSL